jgi:hypothetical protein
VADAWARPRLGIEMTGLVGIYRNPHHGIADTDLLAGGNSGSNGPQDRACSPPAAGTSRPAHFPIPEQPGPRRPFPR